MEEIEKSAIIQYDIKNICHIGAHIGNEASSYDALGIEKVVWVEGNYRLLNRLIKNTSQFNFENIYVPLVLSDSDDQLVVFNITNNEESSSFMDIGNKHIEHYPEVYVTDKMFSIAKRFEDYVKKQNDFYWNEIDMLVLDCQGADLKVLNGMGNLLRNSNLKVIKIEVNFGEMYVGNPTEQEISDYLKEFGFYKGYWFVVDGGSWGDNYYVKSIEKAIYSQNEEQEIIEKYFENKDTSKLRFLDIGANDGVSLSNTYSLSINDWSGICLEPSVKAFDKLKYNYAGNDKVMLCNYGISDVTGKLKFYESGDWVDNEAPVSILSTLKTEERDRFSGMNWTETFSDFYSFNDFIEKENLGEHTFDFINIDCEGYDFIVLKQIDLIRFNAKLICIESTSEEREFEISSHLQSIGFKLLRKTIDNLIFCKN
jgi:FkbM family methyltransferase